MRKIKQSKKLKSKIKISACYIVKNEGKNLPRSIDSLKTQVDEIIVVDTGSTDNTIEIARNYGAKVIETPWEDDFSTPRNLAIDNATGDWIVFIDADEFFIHTDKLRSFIKKHLDIDCIFVMRVDIDEDNNSELNRDWYLRIFRNVDYLRYKGIIHENIENIHGGNIKSEMATDDLILYHTGYSVAKTESKLRRNLRLIQLEIQKFGEKPQHDIALVDCYFALGEHDKVVYHAKKTLNSNIKLISGLYMMFLKLIYSMHQLDYSTEELLEVTNQAIKFVPEAPEFYVERGLLFNLSKQYDKAYNDLKKSIQLYQNSSSNSRNSYFASMSDTVYKKLAELEAILKDKK